MRCYYRNDISCGANRREFEDQSVIKGKLYQIGIRLIRVSHFRGFLKGFYVKGGEEKKKRKKNKGEDDFRYGY